MFSWIALYMDIVAAMRGDIIRAGPSAIRPGVVIASHPSKGLIPTLDGWCVCVVTVYHPHAIVITVAKGFTCGLCQE